MDDTEREDSLEHSEIEITDLDPPRMNKLASTLWQYSERHRLQVRAIKVIFMCLGVFILAIALLPPWLAQLSGNSTPSTNRPAARPSSQNDVCSQSFLVNVITPPGQATGGPINVSPFNGGTTIGSTSWSYQSASCVQGNEVGTLSGNTGTLHRSWMRVRVLHKLSGGGTIIQWYSVR